MFPPGLVDVDQVTPQWWASYVLATAVNTVNANRPDLFSNWCGAIGATDLLFISPDDLLLSGVGMARDAGSAVVSFQGTSNSWQLLTEILMSPQTPSPGVPGAVHGYFGACFQSRLAAMQGVIGALPPNFKVCFTGHSAGGAIAEVACKYFCHGGQLLSGGLVTFGAPRAGNAAFANSTNVAVVRVVVQDDFVPSLPPQISPSIALLGPIAAVQFGWNYNHSTLGFVILADGTIVRGNVQIVDAWGPPNPIPALRLSSAWQRTLAAHAMTNYVQRVRAVIPARSSPINLAPFDAINAQIP